MTPSYTHPAVLSNLSVAPAPQPPGTVDGAEGLWLVPAYGDNDDSDVYVLVAPDDVARVLGYIARTPGPVPGQWKAVRIDGDGRRTLAGIYGNRSDALMAVSVVL